MSMLQSSNNEIFLQNSFVENFLFENESANSFSSERSTNSSMTQKDISGDSNYPPLAINLESPPPEPMDLLCQFDSLALGGSSKSREYKTQSENYLFSKKRKSLADRFIPNRKCSKYSVISSEVDVTEKEKAQRSKAPSQEDSERNSNELLLDLYKQEILGIYSEKSGEVSQQRNLLTYNNDIENVYKSPLFPTNNSFATSFFMNSSLSSSKTYKEPLRKINKTPFKILDAPSLQDDFYLNLIDWSKQNQLAVALGSSVYIWSAESNKVSKLCDIYNEPVTSVIWSPKGNCLGVGTNSGAIQIWDCNKTKRVSTISGQHTSRVGVLAWSSQCLSSGSRDKTIVFRDVREDPNTIIKRLSNHKQEVCGMKWSFDEQQLASGGNDNKLFIWNLHSNYPVWKFKEHTAAVKAIAWSPHQHGLLASGGGTADRTIRFLNTLQNNQINFIDTESQVCNLIFSKNNNELVSTHGYSMNQVMVWKYPSMDKIASLTGHTSRVLYLAMNPEGDTIVTGAGDETLRFWNIFPKKESEKVSKISNRLSSFTKDLR